jgi:endonuclease YncB( thermonuclease family)
VRYVVDGDSLYLRSRSQQVRLWGVDAPENGERGFKAATDYLFSIAQGKRVECRQIDVDRYGRSVARCFLPDGREINRLMIESGTAREYRHFTKGFYDD